MARTRTIALVAALALAADHKAGALKAFRAALAINPRAAWWCRN